MPTVLIAGGSGLIGGHLTRHFKDRGFRVYKLTRKPSKHGHIFWDPQAEKMSTSKLDKIDVLINLVGENIGSKRWTSSRKAQILSSRVQSTHFLASMIPQMTNLKYYIGASGVNCYENLPGKVFTEEHKEKLSEKAKRPRHTTRKPVLQLDVFGNITNEFDSATAAIQILNLKHTTSINNALKNGTKSAGCFWKYKL